MPKIIRIVANLHQDIVKFPLARLISSACLRVRSAAPARAKKYFIWNIKMYCPECQQIHYYTIVIIEIIAAYFVQYIDCV